MTFQTMKLCGALLLVTVSASGCSFSGSGDSGRSNECRWNRSACMYEGSYEPDEESFAEEEARRLNKESTGRLRRR